MMSGKTNDRLDELEAGQALLDTDVLEAVGSSLRGLLDEQEGVHKDQITEMAFCAIKSALDPFPEFARANVLQEFQGRITEAVSYGAEAERHCRLGAPHVIEKPGVEDLLGIDAETKAKGER